MHSSHSSYLFFSLFSFLLIKLTIMLTVKSVFNHKRIRSHVPLHGFVHAAFTSTWCHLLVLWGLEIKIKWWGKLTTRGCRIVFLKCYLAHLVDVVESFLGFSPAEVVHVRPRVHDVIVGIAQVAETLVLLYHESPWGRKRAGFNTDKTSRILNKRACLWAEQYCDVAIPRLESR